MFHIKTIGLCGDTTRGIGPAVLAVSRLTPILASVSVGILGHLNFACSFKGSISNRFERITGK